MLTVVDLFAGCGGMSLGFQNAGFKVVAAADHWKPAVEVYRKNFDHDFFEVDLTDPRASAGLFAIYRPDLIIGGPPCQDFSHAGKRDESGKRANLTIAFAEIVSLIKPKYFVMENVDRLIRTSRYGEALEIFKASGYGISMRVIDASRCGVPQIRKRCFVVGELGSADGFLDSLLDRSLKYRRTTVRDYLGSSLGTEFYYRHPRNYERRAVFNIDEPSPTIRGVNRPIARGYPGHPKDATSDLSKVRSLTTTERSLIQTFPPNFEWSGSKTNLEQMIGNAVPVKLAEFVAQCLRTYIATKRKVMGTKAEAPPRVAA